MIKKASLNGLVICIAILGCMQASAAEIKLIPTLDLKEEYNNNIFFDAEDVPKTHDTITTLSPGIKFTGRTERLDTILQSWFHVLRYYEHDEMDATDLDYSGEVGYKLTERWDISADGQYVKDSRTDRDIGTTGMMLGTSDRKRHHYGGSTNYALSEKAVAGISYTYDKDTFDDPDEEDSTSQGANANLSWDMSGLSPKTVIQVQTGYFLYDYDNADITEYLFTVGAKKQITEVFSLSGYVGQGIIRSEYDYFIWFFPVEETSRERVTIGQLMVSYDGETSSASLSAYHDIKPLSGTQGTTKRTSVRLSLSRKFTADLKGILTAEYYLNKATRGELAGEDIDEQTLWVEPRLVYSFSNDLYLQTSYRFVRLKDYEEDQKYLQSVYAVSLVWQYPIQQ